MLIIKFSLHVHINFKISFNLNLNKLQYITNQNNFKIDQFYFKTNLYRSNLSHLYCLPRNPDLDVHIYICLDPNQMLFLVFFFFLFLASRKSFKRKINKTEQYPKASLALQGAPLNSNQQNFPPNPFREIFFNSLCNNSLINLYNFLINHVTKNTYK